MYKQNIKNILPSYSLEILHKISYKKTKIIRQIKKKKIVLYMQLKHKRLLKNIRKKKILNVIFLVNNQSVWKSDSLFNKMMNDEYFNPSILVCPNIMYSDSDMQQELSDTYNFFKNKNYHVYNTYNKDNKTWLSIKTINPDLIFFANPHSITRNEYYSNAYYNYLSCYIPYFYLITSHDDDQSIYNYTFHNAMWKIFLPHDIALERTKITASNNGINALVTGYPACEHFFQTDINKTSVWKKQLTLKKKIIWAPHHTIDSNLDLHLSNFIIYADFFKELSLKYKNLVQWSFKPHPLLKMKLYNHIDWGKNKTDMFYNYWRRSAYTQLDEGVYEDLFLESDAMIHDSGSFLVEYLYVKQPVLYLMTSNTVNNFNEFGIKALNTCYQAFSMEDIQEFIISIINNDIIIKDYHTEFYNTELLPLYSEGLFPSDKIIQNIKYSINRS